MLLRLVLRPGPHSESADTNLVASSRRRGEGEDKKGTEVKEKKGQRRG